MFRRFRVRVRFARAGDVMLRVLIMLFILAIPFAAAADAFIIERYLTDLLPSSFLDLLQPHFRAARERLDGEPRPRRGT